MTSIRDRFEEILRENSDEDGILLVKFSQVADMLAEVVQMPKSPPPGLEAAEEWLRDWPANKTSWSLRNRMCATIAEELDRLRAENSAWDCLRSIPTRAGKTIAETIAEKWLRAWSISASAPIEYCQRCQAIADEMDRLRARIALLEAPPSEPSTSVNLIERAASALGQLGFAARDHLRQTQTQPTDGLLAHIAEAEKVSLLLYEAFGGPLTAAEKETRIRRQVGGGHEARRP